MTLDPERQWWRQSVGLPAADRWRLGADVGPATPWRPPGEIGEPGQPASLDLIRRSLTVRVDPDAPEDVECVVLAPADPPEPTPVVIVPFYGTGTVVGDPGAARPGVDPAKRANAAHLAARGMTAIAVPWWFETHRAEGTHRADGATLSEKYAAPAAEHRRRHAMTALGRSVADLVAVLDSLGAVPAADPARVGAYGHSLGGKLTLFLAALDPRVQAAVASEPGLGFAHSNWGDPWYFGDRRPAGRDLDEVAALIAPRPLLLIRGGDADGAHNADLVAAARRRAGTEAALAAFDHDEGHTPSWPALAAAYRFLAAGLARGRVGTAT